MTQSMISAYESGARQPSLPPLARLVEAIGSKLEVHVTSPAPPRKPEGPLARRVQDRRDEVLAVFDRWVLTNPRLFGSVARGDERPGSDVGVLVDIPTGTGLFALAACQAQLEALLGAPVDLVSASDLEEGVADEVLAQAVAL